MTAKAGSCYCFYHPLKSVSLEGFFVSYPLLLLSLSFSLSLPLSLSPLALLVIPYHCDRAREKKRKEGRERQMEGRKEGREMSGGWKFRGSGRCGTACGVNRDRCRTFGKPEDSSTVIHIHTHTHTHTHRPLYTMTNMHTYTLIQYISHTLDRC